MSKPEVRIVEQPAEKSYRFRYESEGRLSGSIPGTNSTLSKPTYPSIEISNYTGEAIIYITCVDDKGNPRKYVRFNMNAIMKIGHLFLVIQITNVQFIFSYNVFRQHPHKLANKTEVKPSGEICVKVRLDGSKVFEFKDIGVVFVKRQDITKSLENRRNANIDPTKGEFNTLI